jgi:beta-galactosidase/beta-glucuronidase
MFIRTLWNSKIYRNLLLLSFTAAVLSCVGCAPSQPLQSIDFKPADAPLMTKWAKDVSPANAHPEYPRPQMVRNQWLNLNGFWEYAIKPEKKKSPPEEYDGNILVPFPIESALSGVGKRVDKENRLWYKRSFNVPDAWRDKRVLLNFGAVDWEATVWINNQLAGTHWGGYDPFTIDITDRLTDEQQQTIMLSVWDPSNDGDQARGKQQKKPGGINYTTTTGIWQSAWLEPVDIMHIKSIIIVPDIDAQQVLVTAECTDVETGYTVEVTAKEPGSLFGKMTAKGTPDEKIAIAIPKPKLWSPDSPFLYDLKVVFKNSQGKVVDQIDSYFGMRKVSLGKDSNNVTRILFNNKPLFQYGPLDQGFWPDGLYTAPTDEALRYDIEFTKKIGCNMLRKHVKIEPQRFYYWCDKLGILVWQDMPNGNNKTDESKRQFERELTQMVKTHINSPSIIVWVPFNEGWGQHDTPKLAKLVKQLDPSRLVNNASGWKDRLVGDIHDMHKYPGPLKPKNEEKRAVVLGEFGGFGRPVPGHLWSEKGSWGHHGKTDTEEEMTGNYLELLEKLKPLIAEGLSAAVYTQTTDVEVEVNGFMTYDREILKMDQKKITAANKSLYEAAPLN